SLSPKTAPLLKPKSFAISSAFLNLSRLFDRQMPLDSRGRNEYSVTRLFYGNSISDILSRGKNAPRLDAAAHRRATLRHWRRVARYRAAYNYPSASCPFS